MGRVSWPGIVALCAFCAGLGGVGLPVDSAQAYRHQESRIHYQPYSQAAFDQARRENKPVYVFLSAAWCYWCRAFQEQTLERPEVARLMNTQFVPVFVDVDQRQDLQQRYVRKGVPTSVIFTPDGAEYLAFSGTLKKDEFLAGIRQVLARIHQPGGVVQREDAPSVRNVRPYLAVETQRLNPAERAESLRDAARTLRTAFREAVLDNVDSDYGGLGRQDKYPLALVWETVLNGPPVADADREAVWAALERIERHLYDPVDGGFFRYAERRDWGRPHQEKMLVTNARLIHAFATAAEAVRERDAAKAARWARVAGHSLGFLLDVLYRPEGGGFYGSVDGRHPRFYGLDKAGRAKARAEGRAPEVDRTIYAAWNGEAVFLLADLLRRHPEPRLRTALERTLRLLREEVLSDTQGMHGYLRPGSAAEGVGQLKDNAWGALAFLAGHDLTGDAAYLQAFERVWAYTRANLFLEDARAYRTWNVPAGRGWRTGENRSEAVPLETNGVLALALVKAAAATGHEHLDAQATELLLVLGRLDPWLFDDDPDDAGKSYLSEFVYLLRAQDLRIRSSAKPS